MMGYIRNEKATQETIKDGWYVLRFPSRDELSIPKSAIEHHFCAGCILGM